MTPAHAGSGTDGPIGTVARTVGDARFRPGPCPRTADPVPDLARARCGTLTVPENRSRTKEPKASGGSGDDAVSEIPMALAGNLNRDRDVIFMSQRGTYWADPELTCPNIDEFNARALGLVSNAPSTGRLHVEATRACRDRVDARGAERSTYNDIESSADYDALRKTLGVKKWNVFGISYGTHLALNYMRLHPKGIRSVGIDGVLPPSLAGGAVTWKAAREGFDGLFKACEEQPACDNRYPNLKATFLRLVSELEADPVTTTVTVPVHPEPVKVVLDGGNLVGWLTSATHVAAGVPRSIDELAHGDPQRIAEQLAGGKYSPQAIGRVAHGLVHGVFCGQWTPYESRSDIVRGGRRAFPSFPRSMLANAPQLAWLHDDCRAWDVPRHPLDPGRDPQRHPDPRPVRRLRRPDRAQQRSLCGPYAEPVPRRHRSLRGPCGLRRLALRADDHHLVLRRPCRAGHPVPGGTPAAGVRDRAVGALGTPRPRHPTARSPLPSERGPGGGHVHPRSMAVAYDGFLTGRLCLMGRQGRHALFCAKKRVLRGLVNGRAPPCLALSGPLAFDQSRSHRRDGRTEHMRMIVQPLSIGLPRCAHPRLPARRRYVSIAARLHCNTYPPQGVSTRSSSPRQYFSPHQAFRSVTAATPARGVPHPSPWPDAPVRPRPPGTEAPDGRTS